MDDDDDDDDDDDYNYNAIANNNDSYFLNFCDDNEEESWEQKQLKRAIEESIREASVSSASASGASVSSQPRTTATTASSSSSTTTASTTVSTTAETLSSSSLTDEAEQLVLAQTIQLSQIEQHEKEIKESMMMNRAIKESHKSHYEDTQNNISMQLANQLQKQAEPEDIAYAIHESFQSNEKRKLHNQLNNQYTKYKIARSEEKQMGCWDCQNCTFVQIQPYRSNCSECNQIAPSNQICLTPIPTNIKFGLEIEIIVTDGKKDGLSLQSIAESLTTLGGQETPVKYMGYTHQTTPGYWKIVPDGSVVGDDVYGDNDLCFELVSPPVMGENGLAQLRSIMNNVRQLGIATNASCGFHVHIDATEDSDNTVLGDLNSIKRVSQCFTALENAFDILVVKQEEEKQQQHHTSNRRTNRNKYCKSNRLEGFGLLSNRQRWYRISEATSKQQIIQMMNGKNDPTSTTDNKYNKNNLDKNRKLNLCNILNPKRASTYEFRHYGGVEDIFDAECWVRLILLFCYNTATGNGTGSNNEHYNKCLLYESAEAKDELRALFGIVNCPGLEQVFTIDRKLFLPSQQVTNGYWSCLTCGKQFDSSRSLSQHCFALGHKGNIREDDNNNSSSSGSNKYNNKEQYSTKTQVKNYLWSCLTCGKEFDSSRRLSQHCNASRHKYHNSNTRDNNNKSSSSSIRDNNKKKQRSATPATATCTNVTSNDNKIDITKNVPMKKLPVVILGVVFLSLATIILMAGHRDHSQAQVQTHVISAARLQIQDDFKSLFSDISNIASSSAATKEVKVSTTGEDPQPTAVSAKIQKKVESFNITGNADHQNRYITHQSVEDDSATTTMGLEQKQQQRMVVGVNAPLDWIPMTVLQRVADIVNLHYLESALWIVVLLLLVCNVYKCCGGGDHTVDTNLRCCDNGNDRNKHRAGRKRQRVDEDDDFEEQLLCKSLVRSTPSLPHLAPTTPHGNVGGVTIDMTQNKIRESPSEKRQQQQQQPVSSRNSNSSGNRVINANICINLSSSSTNSKSPSPVISKQQARANAMNFAKRDKQRLEEGRGTINTGSNNNSRDTTYEMPTPSSSTNNQNPAISKQEARANALNFSKRDKQRLEEARGTIHIGSNNSRNSHDITKTRTIPSSSTTNKAPTISKQQSRANALKFAKRDKKRLDDAKK